MVRRRREHSEKKPVTQAASRSTPEPNDIRASTPFDFTAKNLTPYGGLLPVATMLEKLDFRGGMDSEATALELGVKFRADVNGSITGVRFYKYEQNSGTHVGNLWTSSGTLLATVRPFTNETASGWQQATFSTPIARAHVTNVSQLRLREVAPSCGLLFLRLYEP